LLGRRNLGLITNEGIVEKPNGSVGNGNDAVVDSRKV
jgi:hypothetical protein